MYIIRNKLALSLILILLLSIAATKETPAIEWSTFIGGLDIEGGVGITLDNDENVYVTGLTRSSDFPITTGTVDITHNGDGDVFVAKLNPSGSSIIYSTLIGGSNTDRGMDIKVDESGNAYVTGYTNSTNFPTTPGAFDRTTTGFWYDAFVAKLNPTGSELVYSTFLGGAFDDTGERIEVDADGNIYITGITETSDFPVTPGAFDTTYNGGYTEFTSGDAFVTKLNPLGSDLVYSTFLGGSNIDGATDIAIDYSGNAYVTGGTMSSNFPTTPGAFDTTFNSQSENYADVFVTKLNPSGTALVYSTFLGGEGHESGFAITIDGTGSVYVAGRADSGSFPTTSGAYDTSHNGLVDVFVAKLSPSGTDLVHSTYIGGSESEFTHRLALDSVGNIYLSGWTFSIDFPVTTGAYDTTHNGQYDAFVVRLHYDFSVLVYSTYLGGSYGENCPGMAIDDMGNAYVTGETDSPDFPTTSGSYDITFNGWRDIYVTKLYLGPPRTAATSPWSLYY